MNQLSWLSAIFGALLFTTTSASATNPPPAPPAPAAPSTAPNNTTPSATTADRGNAESQPESLPAGLSTQAAPASQDLPNTEDSSAVNRPLLVTSVLVLGGSYGASAIVAATSGRPEDQKNLYYPVVGPWMDLANRNCDARSCGNDTLAKGLLVADGIGQGLAAIGIVTSFFIPQKTTRHWYLLGSDAVHAGPTAVGSGYGVSAGGKF